MIESYTTRTRRTSDLTGEYCYIPLHEFENLKRQGAFLWTASHGGNHYGTMATSVKHVFESADVALGIMIITPESVPLLAEFLESLGEKGSHVPIFIIPPSREILEKRLRARGDTEESIKVRLDGSHSWREDVSCSGINYIYLQGASTKEEAKAELWRALWAQI